MAYPALVYGVPYTPPAPRIPSWRGYTHRWTGHDGKPWNLSDYEGGVVLVPGVEGMHMPEFDRHSSTSPALAGSRHRGSRTRDRGVEWAVLVWADESSEEWLKVDRAFWATMHPDRLGEWEVTAPDGQRRRLRCRYEGGTPHAYEYDPAEAGWALYQPRLIAEEPYWLGDPVPRSWAGAEPRSFIPMTGQPVIWPRIGSSARFETATIDNPGDVAAWATWRLVGPLSGVVLTIDGGPLGVPDLEAGEVLVIDTDPRRSSARRDGVDVAGLVDPWNPRAIPPGKSVPITITWSAGSGTIDLEIVPRYFRAI